MPPNQAEMAYEAFAVELKKAYPKLQEGVFGAMMRVELINDGPATIIVKTIMNRGLRLGGSMRFQKSLLAGVVLSSLVCSKVSSSSTELADKAKSEQAVEVFSKLDSLKADPFELRLATQERVDAHKKKITRTMKFHWYARLGLGVGGTALFGYTAYNFMSSWGFLPDDTVVPLSQKKEKQDTRPLTKDDKRSILAALAKLQPQLFSLQWWKNTAIYLCDFFVLKSAFGAIVLGAGNKLFGHFYHDDNIEWFVSKKTRLQCLSAELRAYAEKFGLRGRQEIKTVLDPIKARSRKGVVHHAPVECPKLCPEELHYYRVTLAGICRDLISQAELVVGFMEYKLEQFQKCGIAPSPDELLQPTRLLASINSFVRSMQSLLPPKKDQPDSTEQIKKTFGTALQFTEDVKALVNRFSGIENSVEWRILHGG